MPSLLEAHTNEAALRRKHFLRQLPAIFSSHRALYTFQKRRKGASIVLKLFGAVDHLDAGAATSVFVISSFVDVLKPAPSTDIVDDDCAEEGGARLHIGHEICKARASADV